MRNLRTCTYTSRSAIFLDLSITLTNGVIHTTIYEKPQNLYLYIPPSSCHAPGILKGLIFGAANRAKTICSDSADRLPFMEKTFYRLINRGHSPAALKPIFEDAIRRILSNNHRHVPRPFRCLEPPQPFSPQKRTRTDHTVTPRKRIRSDRADHSEMEVPHSPLPATQASATRPCHPRHLGKRPRLDTDTPVAPSALPSQKRAKTIFPLFFHMPYNPLDPHPSEIYRRFDKIVLRPDGAQSLQEIPRLHTPQARPGQPPPPPRKLAPVEIESLQVCFHNQKKLGSILSPRRLRLGQNFSVSSFFTEKMNTDT